MTEPTGTSNPARTRVVKKEMVKSGVPPIQVEAQEDITDVTFEYDGVSYTVDKNSANDVDVLEAFEDQKVITPMRFILGDVQWQKFKAKKRTAEDLTELAEVLFKALGMDLGESIG